MYALHRTFFRCARAIAVLMTLDGTAQTVPKVWDEAAFTDWATPVAGLNVRPGHISAEEYYSAPVEIFRTYPVYYPGREPAGYWEKLQNLGPKPIIDTRTIKTDADWIAAGRRVFEELDSPPSRTLDPKLIALARTEETFSRAKVPPNPDGTIDGMRWVPTKDGVALGHPNCASCHVRFLPDGTRIDGAPGNGFPNPLRGAIHLAKGVVSGTDVMLPELSFGERLHAAFAAPWADKDSLERLRNMSEKELRGFIVAAVRGGGITRWNGSPMHPAKVPDLIGVKERKYLDHTGTHLHRDASDFMRYAAQVSYAEATDFGPHHMLPTGAKRIVARASDETLYALTMYIYSLKPPPNPNEWNAKAEAGQRIFAKQGCTGCHTPPLYTNNKLTLAEGFTPPPNAPKTLDVLAVSVHTDPGLALKTRKGTGYYKVPSLKGLWYRGHYLHDGSVASLDEMFNPDRLLDTHEPGGWTPPDVKRRAIKGHEFGLNLKPSEREELIAFLRTL